MGASLTRGERLGSDVVTVVTSTRIWFGDKKGMAPIFSWSGIRLDIDDFLYFRIVG